MNPEAKIYKRKIVEALMATADKYLHPAGHTFFSSVECPMCLAIDKNCASCPLESGNYHIGYGCISHAGYEKLSYDINHSSRYKYSTDKHKSSVIWNRKDNRPLASMKARAYQLKRIALAVNRMRADNVVSARWTDEVVEFVDIK